jgi:RHS repeat-associated protein
VSKDLPTGSGADYNYSYDNLGRMTQAAQPSIVFVVNFTYDALGRRLSETGPVAFTSYEYDPAGRRTRLHFNNGGPSMHYDHLVTGELAAIRENGATSGAGVLATFGYDSLGRRTSLTRGNGAVTSYTYDSVSRLASQSEDLAGTSHDQSSTFTFNPAGQIASVSRSNDTYAFTGHANASRTDTHNGLNQVTASGSTGISHDARGNTDGIGSAVYAYDLDNRLRQASGGAVLNYDPLGRLTNSYDFNDIAGTIDYFARDGARIIGEAASGGGIARRYVHGEGLDEVLVQYEGSGTSDRRWLHADERGSVVAVSDGSGAATAVNRYDEYGNPQGGTISGRFGYTGQAWLPELGMWYYKARIYNPRDEGGDRFMQTDPIGYGDGMNVYVPFAGDPVNLTDSSGTASNRPCEYSTGSILCGVSPQHLMVNGVDVAAQRMSVGNRAVDLLNQALHDCAYRQVCGGPNQQDNVLRSRELRPLLENRAVHQQMERAWRMSFGHTGRSEVHEHGFWIERVVGTFVPGRILEAKDSNPSSIEMHIKRGAIWFHTHPFRDRMSNFSVSDRGSAGRLGYISVMYSHDGWWVEDGERVR